MNDERVEENISAGIIITDSSLVIQVRSFEWQERERERESLRVFPFGPLPQGYWNTCILTVLNN